MLFTSSFLLLISHFFVFPPPAILALDVHSKPQRFCYSDPSCSPYSKEWPELCHKGKHQSPIDLVVDLHSILHEDLLELPLNHFLTDHFFIQNNGHTINLDFSTYSSDSHFFPGYGITPTHYRLSNVHFHWGKSDHDGSEHSIASRKFSMEVHLVHYNEKYNSSASAVSSGDPNALAVVAFFLQVDPNPSHLKHPALAPIVKNLRKVRSVHSSWKRIDEPLDLSDLVPKEGEKLFTYKGSLTTPGCNEQVHWFVFRDPVPISQKDVAAFRGLDTDTLLVDGAKRHLIENHRPTQPLNGRRIGLHTVVRARNAKESSRDDGTNCIRK